MDQPTTRTGRNHGCLTPTGLIRLEKFRNADDKHAVDYAFLWPTVQLLVELKTLGRSHRPGQLAEYLLRARHQNPKQEIALLYLTQPMLTAGPDHVPEGCRYAHIGWPEALEIASAVWGVSDDPREVRCLTLLREHLEAERALAAMPVRTTTVSSSRTAFLHDLPKEWRRVSDEAVASATQAAAGKKVAIDVPPALLSDNAFEDRLSAVKVLLESRIAAAPELAGVKVWWWRSTTSSVSPLICGVLGVEL